MGDLDSVLSVENARRDEGWEKKFFSLLPEAKVNLLADRAVEGPDRWPYLPIEIDPSAKESMKDVLSWLSTRGIGLVINPQKPEPDHVLNYGMIWNFKERNEFLSSAMLAPSEAGSEKFKVEEGQSLLVGPPSQSYLPQYVRTILKQFLRDQGVLAPKVLMVSVDHKSFDLCFSIESLNSPPASEHAGIAEAIAWFLPAHYSISLLSENVVSTFELL